ncbi:hypothetical protein AB0L75_40375 [Streptomyces sp. NPDC052101]|uniref:hypothetical protein n=1 Tax=Streptomyces sp. NPDC052101 TaxID=3155763 RepID=UPI00342BD2CF
MTLRSGRRYGIQLLLAALTVTMPLITAGEASASMQAREDAPLTHACKEIYKDPEVIGTPLSILGKFVSTEAVCEFPDGRKVVHKIPEGDPCPMDKHQWGVIHGLWCVRSR